MKRTILITGGAGFIGSNFVRYWHENHPLDHLVVLDALTYAGHKENIAPYLNYKNIHFHHGNITNEHYVNYVFSSHPITHVVHFAAESHVDRSIENPDIFLKTNVLGTHALLKSAHEKWKKTYDLDPTACRFHHISTDEVFGTLSSPKDPAFTEQSPYAPRSPYAASKAGADHLVKSYATTYGLPITLSYCSNNYGPYQHPEKLLPLVINNILNNRKLPIYGNGQNQREWIHVEDHCRALELILQKGEVGESYAVGSDMEATNIALVEEVCALLDTKLKHEKGKLKHFPSTPTANDNPPSSLITFVPDRPGHDFRYALNNSKIQELGFKPKFTLQDGLSQTIDWYLDNQNWVKMVMESKDYASWIKKNYGQREKAAG